MKKRKIFYSFLSILITSVFLISVFAPSVLYDAGAKTVSSTLLSLFKARSYENINKYDGTKATSVADIGNTKSENSRQYVYAGGVPLGIKLYCDGVVVVKTEYIETKSGRVNPAALCGLKKGDLIKKINGIEVKTNSAVTKIIEKSGGEKMAFEIERGNERLNIEFSCVEDRDGIFKAGLWIRDSSAGIGTLSFVTEDGVFASLGHGVCDTDTKELLPFGEGVITNAFITAVVKGTKGEAGELCGELSAEPIGEIVKNTEKGIYGKLYGDAVSGLKKYPVALADEVQKGKAEIICTLCDGETGVFEAEITDINRTSAENKNLVVKITDSRLLEKTGGIVQGMSGSPIIQNGMIIGSVTHVFINDPTSGYGIFTENMLEASQ